MSDISPRGRKIGDDELKNIIQSSINTSVGGLSGVGNEMANQRRRSMEYYLQESYGNEVEGRSQVVTSEVSDVIEWMLPDLLEIFTASDKVFEFSPQEMEDEEVSEQASDYVNHIFMNDNPGFSILHDWFKDGLLQKNGIVKVEWDDAEVTKRHTYTGLMLDQVQAITDEAGVEVIEYTEYLDEEQAQQVLNQLGGEAIPPEMEAQLTLHDITILRTQPKGRVKIHGVPPENFLISRRATSLANASYLGDEERVTISDLLAAGYDPDLVYAIPSHDAQDWSQERLARYDTESEWPYEDENEVDPAMRQVWVTTSYVKVDYDNDGIAELRKVVTAGSDLKILENVEVDDNPYCSLTPVPMPHKFFGLSVADWTMDLQFIKSTLLRQWLDNLYQSNNARNAISKKVNLDDLLTPRVGGVVRVATDVGDVGAHIVPLVTAPFGPQIIGGLEYIDKVMQSRTGHSPFGADGLPAELNKTATGITAVLGARQKRLQLIARVFAETGVKELGKKINGLVIKHQDRARTIKLRGEWVEVDPRAWNADMDVTLTVGLGYGSKDQQMAIMDGWMNISERIVGAQGGPNGPLIFEDNIFNSAKKWLEGGGQKNTEAFISDPNDPKTQERMKAAPPKPPDPKLIEVQQKGDLAKQEAGIKAQQDATAEERHTLKDADEIQRKIAEDLLEHDRAIKEIELEHERDIYKIELAHQLEVAKTEAELGLKEGEISAKAQLELKKTDDVAAAAQQKESNVVSLEKEKMGRETEKVETISGLKEIAGGAEEQATNMKTTAKLLEHAIGELNTIAQAMNAPKTIKYKNGKATGIEQGGKTRKIKYDGDKPIGLA